MIKELIEGLKLKVKELLISKLGVENPEPTNMETVLKSESEGKVCFDFDNARHEIEFKIEDDEVSLMDSIKTITPIEESEEQSTDENRQLGLLEQKTDKEFSEIKGMLGEILKGVYSKEKSEEKSEEKNEKSQESEKSEKEDESEKSEETKEEESKESVNEKSLEKTFNVNGKKMTREEIKNLYFN